MSSVGDQIRMDSLLKALQGKDISNLTIIFGKCTECRHNGKSECNLGHRHFMREPSTFCCIDFINKEENTDRTGYAFSNEKEIDEAYQHYMEMNFGGTPRNEFLQKRFNLPITKEKTYEEQIWEKEHCNLSKEEHNAK